MEDPSVSVVIPVYNTEPYIGECLDSVLSQSLSNLEVLCVDDGSTDRSMDIVKQHAARDERVVLLHAEDSSKGPGRARNLGIDAARGQYIGFVDSDDYVHEDMFELLLSTAIDHDLDIAMCTFTKFNDKPGESYGRCTYDRLIPPELDGHTFTWQDIAADVFRLRFAACNKLYRAQFLMDHEIRFSEGIFYEDLNFTLPALLSAESMRLIRRPLYYNRREREGATTFMQGDRVIDAVAAMEELERFLMASAEYAPLHEEFDAFKLRKLLRYLHRNDAEHIEAYYKALERHASRPGTLDNPRLSADERDACKTVRDCTLLEYLIADAWKTHNQVDELKRKVKAARRKHTKLADENRRLRRASRSLSRRVAGRVLRLARRLG